MTHAPSNVALLSLRNWLGAARLPRAFRRAGFQVTALAFPGLLLTRSRDLSRLVYLPDRGTQAEMLATLKELLVELRPALVVPTDDLAIEWLHALALLVRRELPSSDPLQTLLRDSLGDIQHHPTLRNRKALAKLALELDLRAPGHTVLHERADAHAFAARVGFPVVLKAEDSVAGLGVVVCRDAAALDAGITRFENATPSALGPGLLAQSFISGQTAMRAVFAWRGRVLSGLSAIKRETHPAPNGPSSVVEFIEHPEMRATTHRIVEALGYSGFASLDFMLDERGAAHLIELNPRPTPICHLGDYLGRDLCASVQDALAGREVEDLEPTGLPKKVALFPQEWVRDRHSPHFADSFHDVPWDDPDLVEACVNNGRAQMRWGEFHYQESRREPLRAFIAEHEK